MTASEQRQALLEKRIDLGLARPSIADPLLTVETVFREPLIAALPEQHVLASRDVLSLQDLAAEPFILSPEHPKPSYADTVKSLCVAAGFIPRVVQEAREMPTILSLVAAGLGLTLTPASARNLRRTGLIYRPLSNPEAVTDLVAAFRSEDATPVLDRFLEDIRAFAVGHPEQSPPNGKHPIKE